MKYKIFDSKNDVELLESTTHSEIDEYVEISQLESSEYYIQRITPCKVEECESNESQEQHDAYGISTGYWCNAHYNSDKYPYRKDRYPTIEYDGYGERLNDD